MGADITQEHELEPQRITIREVYQSVQGLRRELASRINEVERVGVSERGAMRGDLDHFKDAFNNQITTTQAQVAGAIAQVRQSDLARQALEESVKPVIGYIQHLQEEDAARAKWRGKMFNFVCGAGLIGILSFFVAVTSLLHLLGVF